MQALHRPRLRRCRCALSCTWAIIACSLQGRRRNGAARVQPGAGACFSAERPAGGPCLPQHQPRACSGAVACNPSACQFVTLASRWRSHKQCRCLGAAGRRAPGADGILSMPSGASQSAGLPSSPLSETRRAAAKRHGRVTRTRRCHSEICESACLLRYDTSPLLADKIESCF
ncbi:hypothetical protein FA09DRAFT_190130 [Tilletiopsis washingtonensis]|uniref:Uncharacterized protein n=1 Tax=Tilletiopsis washingtonensis TaxID=58919 RepID=A0A316ZI00_9BASI|nr:hypothetical protein FA09DRAFT_190130 [Tilletiopsis washingtonensis]PWO00553.1 hypothetical protein FA09DRAFT_190130 [Tilletiopsis washingtonensis]